MKKILMLIVLSSLLLVGCETENEKNFRKEIENFPQTKNVEIIQKKLKYFRKEHADSELIKKAEILIKNEFRERYKNLEKDITVANLEQCNKKIANLKIDFPNFREETKKIEDKLKKVEADKNYIELETINILEKPFMFKEKAKIFLTRYPNYSPQKIKKISDKLENLKKMEKKQKKVEIEKEAARRKIFPVKIKKILSKLSKKYDPNQNVTWVNDSNYNNINIYAGYTGKNYNKMWYRMRFKYNGNSWIYTDKVFVIIDGTPFTYFLNSNERQVDYYNNCCEWYDIPFDPLDTGMIEFMIKSDDVVIRFIGQETKDFRLTKKDKMKLKFMLELIDLEDDYY